MIAWNQNNPDLANALRAARQEIARIIDGLAEGAKDVGVDVAVNAILNVFSSSYQTSSSVTVSIRTHRGTLQFTGNKCNILVAAAHAQGAGLGTTNNGQANSRGYPLVNGKPPAANWLGDARDVQKLTNIPIVTDGTLKPGDIVAWRTINGTGQGHSTIHIGGNVLIYAGGAVSPTVNTLSTVKAAMTNHEAPVVRRYNGKP